MFKLNINLEIETPKMWQITKAFSTGPNCYVSDLLFYCPTQAITATLAQNMPLPRLTP